MTKKTRYGVELEVSRTYEDGRKLCFQKVYRYDDSKYICQHYRFMIKDGTGRTMSYLGGAAIESMDMASGLIGEMRVLEMDQGSRVLH